jgi:hypothetical protein
MTVRVFLDLHVSEGAEERQYCGVGGSSTGVEKGHRIVVSAFFPFRRSSLFRCAAGLRLEDRDAWCFGRELAAFAGQCWGWLVGWPSVGDGGFRHGRQEWFLLGLRGSALGIMGMERGLA